MVHSIHFLGCTMDMPIPAVRSTNATSGDSITCQLHETCHNDLVGF